MADVMSSIKWI